MAVDRLQRFVLYLQKRNLMSDDAIRRCLQQMRAFDRSMGIISSLLGYIPPEHINTILLEQAQKGDSFGEAALKMKLMTPSKIEQFLKLQREDMYLFSQAAVMQNILSRGRIMSYIQDFLEADRDAISVVDENSDEAKARLDREVQLVLERIKEIASLPKTAQHVLAMLDEPYVDLDRIADEISFDPGTTATLLRVVNSANFGLVSQVTTVKKAVVLLGTDKLRSMIIAVGTLQKFKDIPKDVAYKFWINSLRTAEWSKECGKRLLLEEADSLFVCGLLHNIGELVIRQFFRPQQERIDQLVAAGKGQLETEKEILGATHADLGGFLFNIWRLPKPHIQSAMLHHHFIQVLNGAPDISTEATIVHMSAAVSHLYTGAGAGNLASALEELKKQYHEKFQLLRGVRMDDIAVIVDENLLHVRNIFGKETTTPARGAGDSIHAV